MSKPPSCFVVGHPRRHHLYQTALAYLEAGALARWVTEVYVGGGPVAAALRLAARYTGSAKKLCNYSFPHLDEHVLVAQPDLLRRNVFRLLGSSTSDSNWEDSVVAESNRAQAGVHLPCVHAERVFERLHGCGRPLVLEQYIADRRQGRDVLLREADALGVRDRAALDGLGFAADRIAMNEAEYSLAHTILAGSEFVRSSLLKHGVVPSKVVVAEYGVDLERWAYRERRRHDSEPLEVAFIGSGALRKGLLRLLRAARIAGRVRVHVFGNVSDLPGGFSSWEQIAVFHGHLPQADLIRELGRCHAFALPSLWEGSALVVGEAMASGLPVVVSPNAGSWARNGLDGFVVPVGDEIALAEALRSLFEDPRRVEMGRNARRNAELHTWQSYRRTVRTSNLGTSVNRAS